MWFSFTKNPNLKKKLFWGGGGGRGLELVNFFTTNPNLKLKKIGEGGLEGGGGVLE